MIRPFYYAQNKCSLLFVIFQKTVEFSAYIPHFFFDRRLSLGHKTHYKQTQTDTENPPPFRRDRARDRIGRDKKRPEHQRPAEHVIPDEVYQRQPRTPVNQIWY